MLNLKTSRLHPTNRKAFLSHWLSVSIVYPSLLHFQCREEESPLGKNKFNTAFSLCYHRVCLICILNRFAKDPDGSLGILIARGVRGGIFLMGLTPNGPAHRQTSLKPGK